MHDIFIGCGVEYSRAKTVVFGVPFDGTASYRPGTRFAGKAIRSESFSIETFSPYQDRDLTDLKIHDGGDLEIPFGNTQRVIDMTEDYTAGILSDNKLPFMIGGEHLVSLGAIKAALKKYPDLHLIHFDAHTDLRDDYLGEKLSHATVIRRAWELLGDNRIYQFGIRSGDREEFMFAREHTFLNKFDLSGLSEAVEMLKGRPVYFTLDLDVLDSSVLPGTGTPEAGGISFNELLQAVTAIGRLNIVGCDMVELSPPCDQSGASTALACKLLRELLISTYK